MGELPQDVLTRVHKRVTLQQPGRILVDLARVAASTHPDLQPLRNWAHDRLTHDAGESPPEQTIQVDAAALDAMATLCGIPAAELTEHVHKISA
jgi:hypothetical protein